MTIQYKDENSIKEIEKMGIDYIKKSNNGLMLICNGTYFHANETDWICYENNKLSVIKHDEWWGELE